MTGNGAARVCMASLRGFNRLAGWCSNYEFEDVAISVDDVALFELNPGRAFDQTNWVAQRMMWRPGLKALARRSNPGLKPITLERDYELFVFICMNALDLIYLNAIKNWRERAKTAICYVVEVYSGQIQKLSHHLGPLAEFDHVCLGFSTSVDSIRAAVGKPTHHVALGVDALRFTPLKNSPPRPIDVYCMGRRLEWAHDALLRLAAQDQVFYIYDTIPSYLIRPPDHRQHRDLVASLAKRSRCFVTSPAKAGDEESHGQSEVGARFFEGAAAGTVMIGQRPTSASFQKDFGWPDSVIEIGDEPALMHWLEVSRRDPARLDAIGKRNAIEALRRHDWVYRWRRILEIAGLEPTSKLSERERRMQDLAQAASSRS
jgi:Glycosyl transferases group 1